MADAHALGAAAVLLIVMLVVSWAVRRSTSTTLDFYLASRQVGPFLNACAICGDYFSAASFLGVAGAVYAFGLDGVWFATGFAAGFVVVLLFLAAPLRRAGHFSIPDFLAHRFSSQSVRLTAVVIVLLIVLVYLIPQMVGAGLTWEVLVGSGLFGLSPYATGIMLSIVAIAIHAVVGGMRATTWNQALQFGLLFFTVFLLAGIVTARGFSYPEAVRRTSRTPLAMAGVLSPEQLVRERPDGSTRLDEVRSVMSTDGYRRVVSQLSAGRPEIEVLLPVQNRLHPDRPARFGEPGARFDLLQQIALVLTLLLGTAGLPHIVNRYFTTTSGRAARVSTAWVLALAGAFYFLAVMLGVASRWELPSLAGGVGGEHFVDGVVRAPETALLLLAQGIGDSPMLALVATAALAAIFSTVAGLLIAAATSWGHDVYEQFVNPFASERRRVVLGQISVIASATVAALAGLGVGALNARPSVALMVTWAFAVAGSAFTPVFLLSVWWKRTTARGAITGMMVGATLSILLIVFDLLERNSDLVISSPLDGFSTLVAAPAAVLCSILVSLANPTGETVTPWLRMHGTAAERRQAALARLAADSGVEP